MEVFNKLRLLWGISLESKMPTRHCYGINGAGGADDPPRGKEKLYQAPSDQLYETGVGGSTTLHYGYRFKRNNEVIRLESIMIGRCNHVRRVPVSVISLAKVTQHCSPAQLAS